MKTENNSNRVGQRPSRWMGLALAIVAVVGVSYGAWRLWNKPAPADSVVVNSVDESVVVPVEGMTCSACVARVKKTLKDAPGVSEVNVSLEKREAEIRYEPAKTSPDKLAKVIDEIGYKAGTPRMKEKVQ